MCNAIRIPPFRYLFLIIISFGYQAGHSQNLLEQIDLLIEPAVSRELFSGVVLIAEGDEVMYHKAFGYSNYERKEPNKIDTRFGIGSITKVFTSILVERMIIAGRLKLKDPVASYIPGFPAGPDGGVPLISHLYNHRSGVPHRVTSEFEESKRLSSADVVNKVINAGLLFEPGERRLYSSAGYTVLADIVEKIEERPFHEIIEDMVFGPAGMSTASDVGKNTPNVSSAVSNYLMTENNELVIAEAPEKHLGFLTGAGSVHASATDLLKFKHALEKDVFSTGLWKKVVKPKSSKWTGWNGRTNGYWSYLNILPSQDITLIILTNLGSAATWQIQAQLQNLLSNKGVSKIDFPPEIATPFESLETLAGNYDNNGRLIEIKMKNGRIYRGENEFYPISDNRYYTLGSGSIIRFRKNESGQVDALIQIRGKRQSIYERIK